MITIIEYYYFQVIKYTVQERQQEAIKIHSGLTCFKEGVRSIPIEAIPGIRETGWKPAARATRVNKYTEESSDPETLSKQLKIVLNAVSFSACIFLSTAVGHNNNKDN